MEVWYLYDKNRNKLDITMNKDDKVPENCYRLAGNICIFNSLGIWESLNNIDFNPLEFEGVLAEAGGTICYY